MKDDAQLIGSEPSSIHCQSTLPFYVSPCGNTLPLHLPPSSSSQISFSCRCLPSTPQSVSKGNFSCPPMSSFTDRPSNGMTESPLRRTELHACSQAACMHALFPQSPRRVPTAHPIRQDILSWRVKVILQVGALYDSISVRFPSLECVGITLTSSKTQRSPKMHKF